MKIPKNVSLFVLLDGAVQRAVDAGAFFLMCRLRCGKALIRYALTALMITAFAAEFYWKILPSGKPDIMLLVIVGLLLLSQHAVFLLDNAAEESDAASPMDMAMENFLPILKGIAWLIIIVKPIIYFAAIWVRLAEYEKAAHVADCIAYVVNLILLYLVRTPKTPPPAKERKTVLVPVPVRNEN